MSGHTFRRGMTFVTFITCCASLALLLAALSTQHWIVARARRTTSSSSEGHLNLGLFYGRKNLNVAYGWRPSDINGGHGFAYFFLVDQCSDKLTCIASS